MRMMYYLLAVMLIICSALLYAKSKQVYRLREENKKLREQLQYCALGVSIKYAQWQNNKKKNLQRLFSNEKTTHVSRLGHGTFQKISTVPCR